MPRFGLALIAVVVSASTSAACSVPVFRYALERWSPSPYELIVYRRGPLSATERDHVQDLRESRRNANFKVTEVDLADQVEAGLKAIWERDGGGAALPRVLLRYPESGPQIPSIGSEPLASERLASWLDSPARRAAFDRLTGGYAGVVLLVLSGDPAADSAARALLERELPRVARRIELPPRTPDGPQVRSELPLRVEFPVIEVARGAEEAGLVRMLLGSEDGLDEVRGPIAFPVFGRGRALCSLHGDDMSSGELQRALEFLCRACSCQVKELNPGVDLLIAGNWDRIFDAGRGPAPREVPPNVVPAVGRRGPPGSDASAAELRSPPPPGYDAVEVQRGPASEAAGSWRPYAAGAAVALVLATGLWALWARRQPPVRP